MSEFKLRLRRYDPESGEAPVLGRVHRRPRGPPLGARGDPPGQGRDRRLDRHPLLVPRRDLRLVRRPHQRPDRPGLPHPSRHGRRPRRGRRHRGRADEQHAGDQGPGRRHGRGALEEDPARHAVARQQGADPRARVHRPAREHGRRHAVDGLHPVRRMRVLVPVDGGRPALHRPGRAGQGLPLRRRPPRRRALRPPAGPRPGPARHVRLHALLQLHRGVPQGRRADEPDHAAAAHRRRGARHRRPQQRPPPREGVRDPRQGLRPAARGRAAAALLRRRLVVRQVPPRRGRRAARLAPGRSSRASCAARSTRRPRCSATSSPKDDLKSVQRIYGDVEEHEEPFELNLYITGYDEDNEEPSEAHAGAAADQGQPGQEPEESPSR